MRAVNGILSDIENCINSIIILLTRWRVGGLRSLIITPSQYIDKRHVVRESASALRMSVALCRAAAAAAAAAHCSNQKSEIYHRRPPPL